MNQEPAAGRSAASLVDMQALFRASREAIIVLDPASERVVLANPATRALLGYAWEEAVGRPAWAFVPDWLRPQIQAWFQSTSAADSADPVGARTPVEVPLLHRSGAELWVELTVSRLPRRDTPGSLVVVTARDVTERRHALDALRQSEAERRLALEAWGIGTCAWDLATGQLAWSETLEPLLGLAPGAFGGNFRAFLHQVDPEDRQALRVALARGVQTGADYAGEFRVRWPDGSLHWIAGRARVLRDESGRPIRMIGVGMDISDQMRQARLEGVLLAARTAQHALNNQLAAVLGYAELLETDPRVPPDLGQFAREILIGAQEAVAIVERLRRITRLHEVDEGGPGPVLDLTEPEET